MGENEDKKLSELIESAMLEAPPDDIARRVTPWRRAMVEIVLGLLLTTITFGRGFLYYVLTFAGVLLLLGGFRTLRRVNAGFAWCFRLTLLNTACVVIPRVLDAALPMYVPSFLDGTGLPGGCAGRFDGRGGALLRGRGIRARQRLGRPAHRRLGERDGL